MLQCTKCGTYKRGRRHCDCPTCGQLLTMQTITHTPVPNQLRCLQCGSMSRRIATVHTCACGGKMLPISSNLLPVCRLLRGVGINVSSASDCINVDYIDEPLTLTYLHINFDHVYDKLIFHDLLESGEWVYRIFVDTYTGCEYCHISAITHAYDLSTDIVVRRAIKAAISRFYQWAVDLEVSGVCGIYSLAGMLVW